MSDITESKVARAALVEAARKHVAAGWSPGVFCQVMVMEGTQGLTGLYGGDAAGRLLETMATNVKRAPAKNGITGVMVEGDPGAYAAAVLDSGGAVAFERRKLMQSAAVHSILSLIAIDGADRTLADLEDFAAQVRQGVAARKFRSGKLTDLD
jgi:hypothetical protein